MLQFCLGECFGRSAPRFLHHLAKLVWIIIVGIQAVEFSARDKLDQPVSGRAQLTFMDPERPITSRTIKFLELTACRGLHFGRNAIPRSEEHTSELQSLMRNSYAVFCLKNKQIN